MIEVSHVITRCVDCSRLSKVRMEQFMVMVAKAYGAAYNDDESEIIIRCEYCRKKLTHG